MKCPFWGKYSSLFSGANLLLVFGEFYQVPGEKPMKHWVIKTQIYPHHVSWDSFCNTCNWKTQVSNNDRSNIPANVIQESWKQRARFWDFADLAVVVHQDINMNRFLPNAIALDTPECVYISGVIKLPGLKGIKLENLIQTCVILRDFPGRTVPEVWVGVIWMTPVTKWTNQPTSYPPENYYVVTWQWNTHHLKMYFLLNMRIFENFMSGV